MLHLASKSPRRSELLARLGLPFGVLDLDIPEHRQPGEPAEDYVRRVAREKAGAGLLKVVAVPDALVLGADTEVVLDDEVFGKPRRCGRRRGDAATPVRAHAPGDLRGVAGVGGARSASGVDFGSDVRGAWTRRRSIATSPAANGKARPARMRSRAAATFIAHLSGSHTGVMGLPLYETEPLAARLR